MKRLYKFLLLLVFLYLLSSPEIMSQVSVNTDGSSPDPSAILEIKSNNKGLLLPRIDFNNRPLSPATGILIYVIANGPLGNGLYLFDGIGWLKIGIATYYIGQQAGGGTVFYVDTTGEHGLIAAPADMAGVQWGCEYTLIGSGAQHTAIGTGDTNTTAIVAGCYDPVFAAKVCKSSSMEGYTDWFLPSRDELDSVFVHEDIIGGFDPGWWYWSSSEFSDIYVFVKINSPAWINNHYMATKDYNLHFRCIRKF